MNVTYTLGSAWGVLLTTLCALRARRKPIGKIRLGAWTTTTTLGFATLAMLWADPVAMSLLFGKSDNWYVALCMSSVCVVLMCTSLLLTISCWLADSDIGYRYALIVTSFISAVVTLSMVVLNAFNHRASEYVSHTLDPLYLRVSSGQALSPAALTFSLLFFGYIALTCLIGGAAYAFLAVGTWAQRRLRTFLGIAMALVAAVCGLVYSLGFLTIIIHAYSRQPAPLAAHGPWLDGFGLAAAVLLSTGLVVPFIRLRLRYDG